MDHSEVLFVFSTLHSEQTFACTLRGSYEDAQNILMDSSSRNAPPNHTTFHYAKYCNPKLEMQLLKKRSICVSFC